MSTTVAGVYAIVNMLNDRRYSVDDKPTAILMRVSRIRPYR